MINFHLHMDIHYQYKVWNIKYVLYFIYIYNTLKHIEEERWFHIEVALNVPQSLGHVTGWILEIKSIEEHGFFSTTE